MNGKFYILGGALVVLAVLWAAVTWHFAWLEAADTAALQTAIGIRTAGLTTLMKGLTLFGTWLVYLVVLLAGVAAHKQRGWGFLIIALLSLVLAQLTRLLINLLVHRPRPPRADWLVNAGLYSFPSGHTALAAVGLGLAAWLIWLADRRAGVVAAVVAGLLALLVAMSRIYLGVHWLSDVTASLAFAVVWLMLTFIIAKHIARTQAQ